MKNLLLSGLLVLMALVGWGGHTVLANNRIDLTLKYNTTTSLYEVYGRPNFTDPTFGIGAGTQITIVLPESVADNSLTITSVNGGAWSDASKVYAPTADPTNDFHGIATAGNYTAFVSGQEILLFTFGIAGACLPGVRLFDNTTDPPSSAAGFSGGDYKNYIGDALNAGDDVYQSNYTTPGGLCGTAPTIGFVSPVNGTQTNTTPVISGTATPGASVTIGEGNTTICTTTASSSGTWSCSNTTPFNAGPHTLTAVAGNLTGNSPVATTSFTAVSLPTVAITTPANNGTATTSPTVSGTATPNSMVTLTGPNNTTLCTTAASASGTYSCAVTVAPGPNSITAVACNAGGCSSPVVSNFTVVGPASLTVAQPQPGPSTQPISGTATPGSTVSITGPGNATLCVTTASASGIFSCTVTLPNGPSSVTVTACNTSGCASQPVSVTVVNAPTVSIDSPGGPVLTTSPTVSGTATPGSVVTLTGPNNITLCSTTATASGSYSCVITLPAGPTTVTATASNSNGTSSTTATINVTGLRVRAYLQGALVNPYTPGRMRDDLRMKGVIPTNEPYTSLGYTHTGGGGETVASSILAVTGANAIVDWVVVELRNANTPSAVVATRSALLQSDGDIVSSTDGVSPVTFGSGVVAGSSYYVAVRHRNHLGVMTATAISTSATTAPVVDFTNASTPVYQYPTGNILRSSAPMATQDGLPALWAGNTSGDNQVIMQGPNNDPDPIFFNVISDPGNTSEFSNYVRNNVYSASDVDLNGRVIFQGPNNEVDFIFFEVMTHPDNQVNQYVNFIIRQQIP